MSGNINANETCTLTNDCCGNTIYSAEESAIGSAITTYGSSFG